MFRSLVLRCWSSFIGGMYLVSSLSVASAAPQPLPSDMAPWFEPPADLAEQLGDYRSPLLFEDGSLVKTPDDWTRRRQEILQKWHRVMGAWPKLLAKPRMEFIEWSERDNFIQHRIRVEIAAGRMADGYLLVPNGKGTVKLPAVLVPFYEPETSIGLGKPQRDFAYQLAKRGFVTLSIGSPGGDARKPDLGDAKCQPLSYLGYIAANCAAALGNLPEVDAQRIGVVGHSYGGKWSMFASCLSERFACAVWSDLGVVWDEQRKDVNYWDPWYLGLQDGPERPRGLPSPENPRTGAYRTLVEQGMDLHELHALMAPRPFLVSGGSEDSIRRWIPLNHAVAVNRLLGYEHRVAMTNRPMHSPTPEACEQMYRFFEHFLGDARNAAPAATALK